MPSNLKNLINARMEKTGESWQTAARHVRSLAETPARPPFPPEIAAILRELHVEATFPVLVGRVPAAASGVDFAEVQRRANELAANPLYYAESGSASSTISLALHNLLITHGAAHDEEVQVIRSYKPAGEYLRIFSARTFSDQCESCDGWIWCGEDDHEGECVCGQRYRVSFDLLIANAFGGGIRQEACCIDCGRDLGYPMKAGSNPWRPLNRWQLRCDACHQAVPKTADDIAAINWRARRRFRRGT